MSASRPGRCCPCRARGVARRRLRPMWSTTRRARPPSRRPPRRRAPVTSCGSTRSSPIDAPATVIAVRPSLTPRGRGGFFHDALHDAVTAGSQAIPDSAHAAGCQLVHFGPLRHGHRATGEMRPRRAVATVGKKDEENMVESANVPTRAELVRRASDLVPVLRANAAWTDENRRLHEETIEALADAGIFRMRAPARYGGFESDAQTLVDVGTELDE